MDKLLRDIVTFGAHHNNPDVYLYNGKTKKLDPKIILGWTYSEVTYNHFSIGINSETGTAGLCKNESDDYRESITYSFHEEGKHSRKGYLSSLSDDVSSGTYFDCYIPIQKDYFDENGDGKEIIILKTNISNYSYREGKDNNGLYVPIKNGAVGCSFEKYYKTAESKNGKYLLFFNTWRAKESGEKAIETVIEKGQAELKDLRKIVPDANFALISPLYAQFLITDKNYKPLFKTSAFGIVSNTDKELCLFGSARKCSLDMGIAMMIKISKSDKTFWARTMTDIQIDEYSITRDTKSKDSMLSVSLNDIGYDMAVLGFDSNYMYMVKSNELANYADKETAMKYAYKYNLLNGEITLVRRGNLEVDDIYESKK